ncbi:MAG TPA: hypothetical protein VH372_11650 [Actinospica sp.]|nr:hypothetical protein [Actinospica sp.]
MSTEFPEGGEEGGGRLRRPARIVRPARRRPARPASRAGQGPESAAALGLDPADLADALLADLAEVAGQRDPFEFEMLVSSFCGILDVAQAAALTGALPPDVVPMLLSRFEARRDRLSLAVLATLALLAEGEAGAAAARAAARLWRGGVLPPDWFDELDRSLLVDECLLVRRPFDAEPLVLLSFRRAGRRHAFAVVLRRPARAARSAGAATEDARAEAEAVAPLPAEVLPERLAELVDEIVPPEELQAVIVERIEPVQARVLLETALRTRAVHDARLDLEARFAQWEESAPGANVLGAPPYPAMIAALRARVEALPIPPRSRPAQQDWAAEEWDGDDGLEFDLDIAFPDFPAAFGAGVLEEWDTVADAEPGAAAEEHGGPAGAAASSPQHADRPKPTTRRFVSGLPPRRGPMDGPAPVYRLRIDLKGAKPPIWRRLEVPGNLSLAALHRAIQAAFGWDGYHLHVFETPFGDFGDVQVDLGQGLENEVTVEQILAGQGAKLTYVYDYGDYWEHVVRVERTEPARPGTHYPRCTGGRRAAPPEDCGGLWEYQRSLLRQGDAGAERFDLAESNRRLAEGRWYEGSWGGGEDGGVDGFHWGQDTPS